MKAKKPVPKELFYTEPERLHKHMAGEPSKLQSKVAGDETAGSTSTMQTAGGVSQSGTYIPELKTGGHIPVVLKKGGKVRPARTTKTTVKTPNRHADRPKRK